MSAERPVVLIFDVNETLSDLTPLRGRFQEIGAPADLMPLWFAGILRDGFALAAADAYADFADLARDSLRGLLTGTGSQPTDLETAVGHVVSGFSELDVHPDVPAGVRALRAAGYRLVTMTNGSTAHTDRLLDRAGLRDCFDALWDVAGPRRGSHTPAPTATRSNTPVFALSRRCWSPPTRGMSTAPSGQGCPAPGCDAGVPPTRVR